MTQEEKGMPWNNCTFQSAVPLVPDSVERWLVTSYGALFHGWLVDSWLGSQQNCINRKAVNQLRNKPYGSELPCALPTRGSRSICHRRCPVTTISELLTGLLQSKETLLVPAVDEELTSWLLIMQRNTLWNFHSCLLSWFVRLVNALKYILLHAGNGVTSFSFLTAFQSVTKDKAEPKAAGSQGRWSKAEDGWSENNSITTLGYHH